LQDLTLSSFLRGSRCVLVSGKSISDAAGEPLTSAPQELVRYTREELQRWRRVMRESGARAD